jgi:DNA-binding NarL/FixJ family response regulator
MSPAQVLDPVTRMTDCRSRRAVSMTVCRVGLVDDHPLYARALGQLLATADDVEWCGSAATVDELVVKAPDLDVVMLDLRLADGTIPHDNIQRLHDRNIKVLVYTSGEHPELLRSAARAGVLGVVLKSEKEAVVLEAIRCAAHGEPVLTTDWAVAVDGDPGLDKVDLTAQQQRVLTRWAEGEKAATIARGLGIGVDRVNEHKRNIRLKFAQAGRPTRTDQDVLKRAMEDGWVPYPIRRKPLK